MDKTKRGTHAISGAIFEEVERARRGDDGEIAERCRVDERARIVEQIVAYECVGQEHGCGRASVRIYPLFPRCLKNIYAPPDAASAFPKVCSRASTRSSTPNSATRPRPR